MINPRSQALRLRALLDRESWGIQSSYIDAGDVATDCPVPDWQRESAKCRNSPVNGQQCTAATRIRAGRVDRLKFGSNGCAKAAKAAKGRAAYLENAKGSG